MTGRAMRKTAMPRGRPPRPRRLRQRRKRRRSRRKRKSSVVSAQDVREAAAGLAGVAVVPPFDHADIVAGQATVGLEIAEQLPDVRTVLVPVGGGGLIAGVVTGLAAAGSRATVWGVEPVGAPKLKRSLEAGHPVRLERTASIADGLITLGVGDIPCAQLAAQRDRVAGVALVEDDTLREAVHFLWQHCHLAVEPSGAATTAAVRSGAVHPVPPTVLVVSGGNVDPSLLED